MPQYVRELCTPNSVELLCELQGATTVEVDENVKPPMIENKPSRDPRKKEPPQGEVSTNDGSALESTAVL